MADAPTPANRVHSLLTPQNCTVIFIDHQPQMTFGVMSIDRQLLVNNVIGLAKARGIKVVERAILPQELAKADEVFLTGSAAEVTPVGEIIGTVGDFRFTPGTICRLMWEDYDRAVGKQVATSAAAE